MIKYISECAILPQKVHGKRLSKAVVNIVIISICSRYEIYHRLHLQSSRF